MEKQCFTWNEVFEGLAYTRPDNENIEKKKVKRKKSKIEDGDIYCPHSNLIFDVKETLNFNEQTRFHKKYERRIPANQAAVDVVLLQDVKNIALYLFVTPFGTDLISFLHLPIVDRFLRALIVYMQHFSITWCELRDKRAAAAKRAPNPLAGGARVQRAQELKALRCVLAREYSDLLLACQKDAQKYHHSGAGLIAFAQTTPEKDFRIFEGLIQFSHRVVWIALERQLKEMIEVEIHRLFRSEAFNMAQRHYAEDWGVPQDERWILYGPQMPVQRKIFGNSPLPYEIISSECDYRLLSLGLTKSRSEDPRIQYLENALLAKEEDLVPLGIKVGILGLPRSEFDLMLIRQASEEDQVVFEESGTSAEAKGNDEYEMLMPLSSSNRELDKPYPLTTVDMRHASNDKIRKDCKNMWLRREHLRKVDIKGVETLSTTTAGHSLI